MDKQKSGGSYPSPFGLGNPFEGGYQPVPRPGQPVPPRGGTGIPVSKPAPTPPHNDK